LKKSGAKNFFNLKREVSNGTVPGSKSFFAAFCSQKAVLSGFETLISDPGLTAHRSANP
jgi:hypothetical protein